MKGTFFNGKVAAAWLIAALTAAPGATMAAEHPNIILFLVDDLGWQDTSVAFWNERTPANDHFHTPNVERLARDGIVLTDAYACAICSPSRTSLMTGQNAARHRVTNWTLYPGKDQSGSTPKHRSPEDWDTAGLQPDTPNLAQLLKGEAGYVTIHCGKAHWGAIGTAGADPKNLGFDVNIAGHAAGGPGHYHGEKNYGNKPGVHTPPWGVPGLEKYHGSETHLTDALTIEAKEAVGDAVDEGKPFFLHMAHYAVHVPLHPHRRFLGRYAGKNYPGTERGIPEVEATYATLVEGFDASLGALLEHVEKLGVAEDTLVVFSSDNGGLSLHARGATPRGTGRNTHCWPLREGKGSAYEGGTRVPWVASWAKPAAGNRFQKKLPIKAGSRSNIPTIIEDLFPTLLGVAGVDPPEGHVVDGWDLGPVLSGEVGGWPGPRPLIFHYPHQWTGKPSGGYQPHSAIRLGEWKAIYFYEFDAWQLFDLSRDIKEAKNVAATQAEVLPLVAQRLIDELASRGALMPVRKSDGSPHVIRKPYQPRQERPGPAEGPR